MKPKTEPLLFRPRVFYSIAGTGLAGGILGLTPAVDTAVGWWTGFLLASACVVACLVCWAIPVRIEVGGKL